MQNTLRYYFFQNVYFVSTSLNIEIVKDRRIDKTSNVQDSEVLPLRGAS